MPGARRLSTPLKATSYTVRATDKQSLRWKRAASGSGHLAVGTWLAEAADASTWTAFTEPASPCRSHGAKAGSGGVAGRRRGRVKGVVGASLRHLRRHGGETVLSRPARARRLGRASLPGSTSR